MNESNARRISTRIAPLLVASLALVACGKPDAAGDDAVQPVVSVRTAVVARRSIRETLDGIGTVSTRPDHVARLSAPALTRVTRIDVTTPSIGARSVARDRNCSAAFASALARASSLAA